MTCMQTTLFPVLLAACLCMPSLDLRADEGWSWWRDAEATKLDQLVQGLKETPQSNMEYPSDWKEISEKRTKSHESLADNAPPAWKRAIQEALAEKVQFDFVDTSLGDALNFLQDLTGVTMICDPLVKPKELKLTLKVSNMSGDKALKWMTKMNRLDYALLDGAVFVSTPDAIQKATMEFRVYPIADLVVPDFPGPAHFGITPSPERLRKYRELDDPFGWSSSSSDRILRREDRAQYLIEKIEQNLER